MLRRDWLRKIINCTRRPRRPLRDDDFHPTLRATSTMGIHNVSTASFTLSRGASCSSVDQHAFDVIRKSLRKMPNKNGLKTLARPWKIPRGQKVSEDYNKPHIFVCWGFLAPYCRKMNHNICCVISTRSSHRQFLWQITKSCASFERCYVAFTSSYARFFAQGVLDR